MLEEKNIIVEEEMGGSVSFKAKDVINLEKIELIKIIF
jgi:hypothetical protein